MGVRDIIENDCCTGTRYDRGAFDGYEVGGC